MQYNSPLFAENVVDTFNRVVYFNFGKSLANLRVALQISGGRGVGRLVDKKSPTSDHANNNVITKYNNNLIYEYCLLILF